MLCTVEDVKLYLGIETTSSDTLLTSLIVGVSGFIENVTDRVFSISDYTEVRDGTGNAKMPVCFAPITEITSVKINDISFDVKNTTTLIYFNNGNVFPTGLMNIELKYKAGYSSVPADVKQACIELVAFKFKEKDRIGLNSKGLAGEVISFEKKDISLEIKSVLSAYMRVV